MTRNNYIQPAEIINLPADEPVIFLGGPIQGAPRWQYDARDIIHDIHEDIIVASPRKGYAPGTFQYHKQVDWEGYYLDRAGNGIGTNMFWLPAQAEQTPGRSYGQTTRIEIGEWLTKCSNDPSINLVIGMPGGFGNERYIRHRASQLCPTDTHPNIQLFSESPSLEQVCIRAVELALHKAQMIPTPR